MIVTMFQFSNAKDQNKRKTNIRRGRLYVFVKKDTQTKNIHKHNQI